MLLEWNEQIKAHLMWIWGGEDGFMKRKREGMLVVTEKKSDIYNKDQHVLQNSCSISRATKLLRFKENKNVFCP